jgi:5-methylcytosine-specific restriction endonuclease McrA
MEDCKPCSVCKQILSLENFDRKSSTKTGRASACKPCSSVQKAESYLRNIEHNRKYRVQYYLDNSEVIKERAIQWGKDNPERLYAKSRRWLLSKPSKGSEYTHRRRARVKAAETFLVRSTFLAKLYRSPCLYCGAIGKVTQDHVIPLERGGRHSEGNLVPCCQPCNSSKGIQLVAEWKRKRATPKRDPQS